MAPILRRQLYTHHGFVRIWSFLLVVVRDEKPSLARRGSEQVFVRFVPLLQLLWEKRFLTFRLWWKTTPLLNVCLKTYGTVVPDWYFTGLSNLNFASDCLYRFRVMAFALSETRQSITQVARESSSGIVIPARSPWIYDVWYCAFLVSCNVTSPRAKQLQNLHPNFSSLYCHHIVMFFLL